jgi:tRNA threonylcarbamoyladenosine biosynthesis protein TsaB
MTDRRYILAIETATATGSIALGEEERLVDVVPLDQAQRHGVELMPAIDRICQDYSIQPPDLRAVCVSIGPGSFTGLRIGVTTAKMLAHTTGCALVAVPTLDVIARNAPARYANVAVMLNAKRGQAFTGIYQQDESGMRCIVEHSLMTPDQVLAQTGRPLVLLGDSAVQRLGPEPGEGVQWLDASLAIPRAEVVLSLGRDLLGEGRCVDPVQLTPLYVRLPEAEENRLAAKKEA